MTLTVCDRGGYIGCRVLIVVVPFASPSICRSDSPRAFPIDTSPLSVGLFRTTMFLRSIGPGPVVYAVTIGNKVMLTPPAHLYEKSILLVSRNYYFISSILGVGVENMFEAVWPTWGQLSLRKIHSSSKMSLVDGLPVRRFTCSKVLSSENPLDERALEEENLSRDIVAQKDINCLRKIGASLLKIYK